MACSALKRSYRDRLRQAAAAAAGAAAESVHGTFTCTQGSELRFVFLDGDRDTIFARMAARKGHYMSARMVDGQLGTLEPPGPEESDVIRVALLRSGDGSGDSASGHSTKHSTAAQLLDTVHGLLAAPAHAAPRGDPVTLSAAPQ